MCFSAQFFSLCCQFLKPSVVFYFQPCTEQVESNCQPLKRDCSLHACSSRRVQVYLCSLEAAKRSTRAVKWMTVKPERDGSLGVAESKTVPAGGPDRELSLLFS